LSSDEVTIFRQRAVKWRVFGFSATLFRAFKFVSGLYAAVPTAKLPENHGFRFFFLLSNDKAATL
jgi:hypothetical protein